MIIKVHECSNQGNATAKIADTQRLSSYWLATISLLVLVPGDLENMSINAHRFKSLMLINTRSAWILQKSTFFPKIWNFQARLISFSVSSRHDTDRSHPIIFPFIDSWWNIPARIVISIRKRRRDLRTMSNISVIFTISFADLRNMGAPKKRPKTGKLEGFFKNTFSAERSEKMWMMRQIVERIIDFGDHSSETHTPGYALKREPKDQKSNLES